MATTYKVKLTPKEAVKKDVNIGTPFACPNCGEVIAKANVNIRTQEIEVLKAIFNSFAGDCKELKKCNIAWDTVGKLENLTEGEDHIIFDTADMECFEEGFKKAQNKGNWHLAKSVLAQFSDKDKMEIKTEKKKTVESTDKPLETEITPEDKPKK